MQTGNTNNCKQIFYFNKSKIIYKFLLIKKKMLSEKNKKILKYIDSSIQRQTEDIYEILLLTKYCKLGGLGIF